MAKFEFRVREENKTRSTNDISTALTNWRGGNERWLFVAPHDDDIILGAGLLLQTAVEKKIPVRMLITTDGSMGYCTEEQRATISKVRTDETDEMFGNLGISDVRWLNFPDCDLARWTGRRVAQPGDRGVKAGFTGLQNAYTAELRDFCPTRLFVPSGNDYHPDHKTVYQELMISVFHSSGQVWPELGAPVSCTPLVYEMAIYCDFPEPPNLMIKGDDDALQVKLDAIATYRSQLQIEQLVQNVRNAGPLELFREVSFALYHPQLYTKDFE